MAFANGKPPVKPKPEAINGENAAFLAANKAGREAAAPPRQTISRIPTGASSGDAAAEDISVGRASLDGERPELGLVRRRLTQLIDQDGRTGSGHLQPLRGPRSQSHIAATLAASRSPSSSPSQTPNHTGQQGRTANGNPARYVPPRRGPSMERSQSPLRIEQKYHVDIPSMSLPPPVSRMLGSPQPLEPRMTRLTRSPVRNEVETSDTEPVKRSKPIPVPPPKRNTNPQGKAMTTEVLDSPSPLSRQIVASPEPEVDDSDASSDDSFVSASDHMPVSPPLSPQTRNRAQSYRSISPPRRRQTPQSYSSSRSISSLDSPPPRQGRPSQRSHTQNTNMSIDSLANAMVGAAIASSHAVSPSKPPVPAPRRSGNHLFPHHHHHHNHAHPKHTRTPSPNKTGMRTTMRKTPKDDDDDESRERRGRKNIIKKHPNKHHEGDRKRWRDAITERERKRYEAVWASNKGLWVMLINAALRLESTDKGLSTTSLPMFSNAEPGECISNIVVKDIWERSRLGKDDLAEVWELVDKEGLGRLSKEEFVVGMWLIDQRLKGRKLPIRVGDSVWDSVGGLRGVKVKVGKGKGK
jgi:hypothetical protein